MLAAGSFYRLSLLPAFFDEVGHALGDHNGGGVGVGADDVGHHGGIYHPQVFHPVHAAVLVNHGVQVGAGPHFAGAGGMVLGVGVAEQPLVQGGVGGQVGVGGGQAFRHKMPEGGLFGDPNAQAHGAARIRWRSTGSER